MIFFISSGFINDQKDFVERLNNKTHPPKLNTGPGMIEPVERFRLNNLSFAGPVIMGIGGKKIIFFSPNCSKLVSDVHAHVLNIDRFSKKNQLDLI